MATLEAVHESVRRLERTVALLFEQVARIEVALKRIDENSRRNRVVAEKYGDRAESVFSVVDTVSSVLSRANPLAYLPRGLLSDSGGDTGGGAGEGETGALPPDASDDDDD
jgi:hypothetical protein